MKDLIDKYKREPIAIIIVAGIVLYVLYLLISPYRKCMSSAPDKYYTNKKETITNDWKRYDGFCIKNTTF